MTRPAVVAWILGGLVAAVGSAAASDAGEVRGAPLGAPPPAVDAPHDSISRPVPPGADSADIEGLGPPTRVIPEGAWAFLQEIEEKAGETIETRQGSFVRVPFRQLSGYEYHLPNPYTARVWEADGGAPETRLPEEVRALHGENVMVAGFMVPLSFDRRGNVRAFALSQNLLFCCYGIPPAMNEWVMVEVVEGVEVAYRKDVPVAVFGPLDVGEELDDGYVLSIYRLSATEVTELQEAVRRGR